MESGVGEFTGWARHLEGRAVDLDGGGREELGAHDTPVARHLGRPLGLDAGLVPGEVDDADQLGGESQLDVGGVVAPSSRDDRVQHALR